MVSPTVRPRSPKKAARPAPRQPLANPYNCGIPGNFVGYENERKQIVRKLAEGHSYTILGGQQCGKTSFLLQLEKDLIDHRGEGVKFLPRRFDLQAEFPKTVAEFFGCLYRLTTQGLKTKKWDGSGYTDFLKAVEAARPALEKRFTRNWVVVFLIDELDSAATSLPDLQCFQNLRTLLTKPALRHHFRVVAAGLPAPYGLEALDSESLGVLSENSARELTRIGFPGGFPASVEAALFEYSGRHPYVMQALLEDLWDACSLEGAANSLPTAAMLAAVATRFVQKRYKIFERWEQDIGPDGLAVYHALAEEPMPAAGVKAKIKGVKVDAAITRLRYHGVVDDSNSGALRVSGTLFRDWVEGDEWQPHSGAAPAAGPIVILHLTDLHFGPGQDPVTLATPLLDDLKERDIERVDYLVVSGDFADKANEEGFRVAKEFLLHLVDQKLVIRQRLILAPGNHDLIREKEGFEIVAKAPEGALWSKAFELGTWIRGPRYMDRFRRFHELHFALTDAKYPPEPREQALLRTFEPDRIQFLVLNTAWETDPFQSRIGSLNADAIARAQLKPGGKLLTIAVWHHAPAEQNDYKLQDECIQTLEKQGVRVVLHGHVHEDRTEMKNPYLHRKKQTHIIGCGAFGAKEEDRPKGIPCMYNLLQIERDLSRFRVISRQQEKPNAPFTARAIWPKPDDPDEKTAVLEVTLK